MRFFRTAEPPPASRVRLVWGDGSESVVELGPALVKGRVRVLDRPAAFNAVAVGAHGRTLVCATRTATRSTSAPTPSGVSPTGATSKAA
jgi:hypothetical protein